MIQIQWLGHSCMKIMWDEYTVVIDPFADGYVPGLRNIREKADLVLCSHGHGDHNAAELVQIQKGKQAPFELLKISTCHDDKNGTLRGMNTVFLLQGSGFKLVHMGDIGCPLTKEQVDLLKGADVVMTPVGGFYTAEPDVIKGMMDEMKAKVVIPMHYRSETFGFDVLKPVSVYAGLCGNVVRYSEDTLEITKEMKPQTAILTY
ncbi:MAG: MBL fold metallo-hydrolase [Lachnospiraceae bacterium]|nr:MBL fold metallo-hydrolase [Lachnospiraceae bacterium]